MRKIKAKRLIGPNRVSKARGFQLEFRLVRFDTGFG